MAQSVAQVSYALQESLITGKGIEFDEIGRRITLEEEPISLKEAGPSLKAIGLDVVLALNGIASFLSFHIWP